MTHSIILHLFAGLLATGIFLGGNNAVAQQLSPEQAETVRQLKEELLKDGPWICFIRDSNMEKEAVKAVEEQFKEMDPLLVGQNVVFSKNWLQHIGPAKQLTKQQFEQWRGRNDEIYACYEKLTGGPPKHGKKVFIDVFRFTHPYHTGTAHAHCHNVICFSEQALDAHSQRIQDGSWGVMLHELAHVFSAWSLEPETDAEFMEAYALENAGMWYMQDGHRQSGKMHGQRHYDGWWSHYHTLKENGEKMKSFDNGTYDGAYGCYLYGLVDKVGWKPVEKAMQSYNDHPVNYYRTARANWQRLQARDFFEGIAYFSGVSDVLRSLPDNGELLDEHFHVEISEVTKRLLATELVITWDITGTQYSTIEEDTPEVEHHCQYRFK